MGAALEVVRRRVGAEQITSKGGRDLVTATDVEAEDVIRAELLDRCPGYGIVGEERGGEPEPGGRPYWLVDPICGTRNFASDLALYCVNVALVQDGEVALAVVGDGGRGDRYVAERGQGAHVLTDVGPRRLHATEASLTVAFDPGADGKGSHHAQAGHFARGAIASNRWFVRMLGSSLSYAHVAAGRLSAAITFKSSSPVHIAAGYLLAREADAVVTDLDSAPWNVASPSIIAAATPDLHRELLLLAADSPGTA